MFKNLRTGTKLFVLCSIFVVSIAVPIYGLVVEKRIAIDFARKELVGIRYLAILRGIFATTLTGSPASGPPAQPAMSTDEALTALASAQADVAGTMQTGELERGLATSLRQLSSARAAGATTDTIVLEVLATARHLASRIGDDSNLALDPDLDTYYLQSVVVGKLPSLVSHLGEVQLLLRAVAAAGTLSNERKVRFLVLDGLLRSTMAGVSGDLAAAYRKETDGALKGIVDADIAEMVSRAGLYLGSINASFVDGDAKSLDSASLDRLHAGAVGSALKAWTVTHSELERLLRVRIDDLVGKLRRSLMLTGALGGLSVLVAVMTHRDIVRPLERLEWVARKVRETKNYSLRIDNVNKDEIGRLAAAFNDMLSELAAARQREISAQLELARAARLTTMGAMTASIAHEINQPLGAIVANGNAGARFLERTPPDLDEVRMALKCIVDDGHRASEVIGSIRGMFKREGREHALLDVNDLIRQTLAIVNGELRSKGVTAELELLDGLPQVSGNRVQLQQVILNLVMNAAEAMAPIIGRARELQVKSEVCEAHDIMVTVRDSGAGIDPGSVDRIFDAFFSTKSRGMGMGLSICRSIIEAHDGRLWASQGSPHGSIFHVVLPAGTRGGA